MVHCKKCIHYVVSDTGAAIFVCCLAIETKHDAINRTWYAYGDPEVLNKNNDCSYYVKATLWSGFKNWLIFDSVSKKIRQKGETK